MKDASKIFDELPDGSEFVHDKAVSSIDWLGESATITKQMKDVEIGDKIKHDGELMTVCAFGAREEPCDLAPNGWVSLWLTRTPNTVRCNACYQGTFTQTVEITT